ncbi:MAG: WG repeat-containing protein [Muribaculaceae bacterium]|nr:WG repeat-containing protein [Muribaculaceae bacterium]
MEIKEQFDFFNKLKAERNRIAEAGKYDVIKWQCMPDAPVSRFLSICSRGGKDYLVDHTNETVVEVFEADEIKPNLGYITPATFRIGDKWGIVSSSGEIILEAKYDSVIQDANDFIYIELDGKAGLIADGHIIEPKFDSIDIWDDDYIKVTLNGEDGYIDENDEFTTDRSEAFYGNQMFL